MRTALEMTKFVLVHERGYTENPEELDRLVKARLEHMHKKREDLIREGKKPDLVKLGGFPESALTYDSTLRNLQDTMNNILSQGESDYVPLFRPVEQTLAFKSGVSEGNNDVLYALTSHSLWSSNKKDIIKPYSGITGTLQHVAAAFTANRCILVHVSRLGKETFRTIPYDEIIEIRAKPVPQKLFNFTWSWGELIVSTTTDILRFRTCYFFANCICDGGYTQFIPEQACEAVTALVTKYKQAKCAAQQGAAAPQQPQQTPPPPQETSQWAEAQRNTAQQTAARLTAALQAPSAPVAPQQAAPAAPSAGAGLPPETIETLKQLKGLLDADILTQEEFDAKKKQLLGL